MSSNDLKLKAHLLRRAGFGASPKVLDQVSDKSYEELVEDLLHPDKAEAINMEYIKRYNTELRYPDTLHIHAEY